MTGTGVPFDLARADAAGGPGGAVPGCALAIDGAAAIMITLLLIAFHLLGLASAMHAAVTNRTAQGAVAWGVSLTTLPVLTVPLYWVFGRRKFEGYVEAWNDRQKDVEGLIAHLRDVLEPYAVEGKARLPNYAAMSRIAGTPLLSGNDVVLFVDGQTTFASILSGMARAQRYVLVQFYIVHDDGLGRRLKAAMIECARRGVEVYFLYDEIGSKGLPRTYLDDLGAAGVNYSRFNSTQGRRYRFQLNFRNHRKSVIVDGLETWVGGFNVGDEYLGLDPEIGPWRDTHVHITGPAAQLAQGVFLADWYWAKRTIPQWSWTPRPAPSGANVKAMVVPISPARDLESAQLFFVHALNSAKERIWIATPYFVPDPAVTTALRLAALRGVDVRIIVPRASDNVVVDLAAMWFMHELGDAGIHFYRHGRGFMHQKVFLVDRNVSTVGSTNFDNRSFRLQFEVNALLVDEPFAEEVANMLLVDLANSEPYEPSLKNQPRLKRIAASIARLAAPLL